MTFSEAQLLFSKGLWEFPQPELKDEWNQVYENMIIHSRGILPEKYFNKAFPNEVKEVEDYRKANYQPITRGSYYKGFTSIYRALSESSYSIVAPDYFQTWMAEARFPIESNTPGTTIPLKQFFIKNVLWRKLEDPNGISVTIPVGKKNGRINVIQKLILSKYIRHIGKDVVVWESPIFADKKKIERYEILTNEDYLILTRVGQEWNLEQIYNHNIGQVPYTVNGGLLTGKICTDGTEKYFYDSDFSPFVAHANMAIVNKELHKGTTVTSSFPIRIMKPMPCKYKHENKYCVTGTLVEQVTGKDCGTCPGCHGTGKLIPTSPYRGIMYDETTESFSDKGNVKMIDYAFPPVDIIKINGEESDKDLQKAESALHLRFIEMAQSGVAKEYDKYEQDAMLFSFSDYFFSINFEQPLNFMRKYIFPEKSDEIKIRKPISFKIQTAQELLAEFQQGFKDNLPAGILTGMYLDYIRKRFAGDSLNLKAEQLAMFTDPYYIYPIEVRNQMEAQGILEKSQIIKTINLPNVIQELIIEIGEVAFLEIKISELKKKVIEKLEEFTVIDIELPDLELVE